MECSSFDIKTKDFRWKRARTSIINKRLVPLCSVIDIVLLWNFGFMGRLYFFIVNGYNTKFNFYNVPFFPYFYLLRTLDSLALLFMKNLI